MTVSIIILTFNQSETTIALLDSLSEFMSRRIDTEIILVDNGSDGTMPVLIEQKGYTWTQRINLIHNDRNLGVAAGRNVGLKTAAGNIIILLDNDTIVSCQAISSLVDYVASHHHTGIAAPALKSQAGELQDSAKPYPGIMVKLRHIVRSGRLSGSEIISMQSPHPCYVIGACQVFRREILEKVGYLDENIFYGPEDADFCIRVKNAGYSIDYLPGISLIHHWRRSTRRNIFSPLARKHIRALFYFYKKHRRYC